MLHSMTGYGRGHAEGKVGTVTAELRGVNARFLDIATRMPQEFSPFDPIARQELQKRFSRGKISLNIQFVPIPGAAQQYTINEPMLDMLIRECQQRDDQPDMNQLLTVPGVVMLYPDQSQQETLEQLFRQALGQAMDAFAAERAREGEALRQAMRGLHREMTNHLRTVTAAAPSVVEKYRERLRERLEELLGPKGPSLDAGRLEQEVAFFADKADISEEVTRLNSHLERLDELTQEGKASAKGRALDFLTQEILREVNTIGSKCRDLDIARQVLDLKSLVEALKEQVANVE